MSNMAMNVENLSAEGKRQLLARLLEKRAQKIKRAPLSFGQERLWFLHQLDEQNAAYNLRTAVHLRGALNVPLLQESIQAVVNRHESLRTTIVLENGRSFQKITPFVEMPFPILDLSHLDACEKETAVQQEGESEAQTPYDFSTPSLFRVKLLKLEKDEHILLMGMHHIISDGWSIGILIREVGTLYQANLLGILPPLQALTIQYADFAAWQKEQLQGDGLQAQLDYWRHQLRETAVIDLPTDHPRPPMQTFVGARQYFTIDPAVSQTLRDLTQSENATLYMTLLSAFNILLYKYSKQTDITVGSPIAGRTRQQLEGLIGLFINTLVMRNQVDPERDFLTHLAHVRQTALSAFAHQDIPFEKLVKELNPPRDPSRSPIFQHAFVFQNAPMHAVDLSGLTLTTLKPDKASSLFDLTLCMWDNEDGLHGYFEYNTDLFSDDTIARLLTHFQQLLAQVGQQPTEPIQTISMLTPTERQKILVEWNDTAVPFAQAPTVQITIEKLAQTQPNALAIAFADQRLTFQELNERANQLAHHLLSVGVKRGDFVALCVERSPALIWGMLGVMKAGAAYVPLDSGHPPERLSFVLEDINASILLTQSSLLQSLQSSHVRAIPLDQFPTDNAHLDKSNPAQQAREDDLAYAIYTSGSTGKPKGVPISHRSLNNLIGWYQHSFDIGSTDRAVQFAGLAFDASVLEIWAHLGSGASLHLCPSEVRQDPIKLRDWLIAEAITISYVPTPMAEIMLDLPWPEGCAFRMMLTGGSKLHRHPPQGLPFKLVDNYGPSECTVVTTALVVPPSDCATAVPTIGRPISNTRVYVLDDTLQPVPIGVAGELYVGGPSVMQGYINRPELTAVKLIPDPFGDDENGRLYATGDIVRYQADGQLLFLGRVDNQVKIRGFRVELGEIEAVLLQHEQVIETAVLMHKATTGANQLVAYVAFVNDQPLDSSDLRTYLRESLPPYMVPAIFVPLPALPMTPNGKVDYRALPNPSPFAISQNSYVAPRTQTEADLAAIWQTLLKIEKVGVEDNFFELGGDSLLVIQAVSQGQRVGLQLTAQLLFQHQTIAELAPHVERLTEGNRASVTYAGEWPLTADQQWFLGRNLIEPHRFTAVSLFKVAIDLDPNILKDAVAYLVEYHDILRSRFVQDNDGWHQIVDPELVEVPFYEAEVDLTAVLPHEDYQLKTEPVFRNIRNSINLATGPVFQVHYIRLDGKDTDRLLLAMHHLIIDGLSVNVLLQDLLYVYMQRLQGKEGQLPPKSINAKQWVERLMAYADSPNGQQELSYWLNLPWASLPKLPLAFESAYENNTVDSSAKEPSDRVFSQLSEEETAFMLRTLQKKHALSIETMMLAAMTKAITEWTGGNWFSTKMIDNGRNQLPTLEDIDLSRTIGWLSFTRRLMLQWQPEQSLLTNLFHIDEQLKKMPNRGLGYELLYRYSQNKETRKAIEETIPAHEDIWINYVGQIAASDSNPFMQPSDERVGWHMNPKNKRPYLIFCYAEIRNNQFVMQWEYSTKAHHHHMIEQVAQTFLITLKAFIQELK